jgi:DNA-binding GntR family transcriptional regulator
VVSASACYHFSVSFTRVKIKMATTIGTAPSKTLCASRNERRSCNSAPLSVDEAREIYEIRAALESLAMGLAIPAHTLAKLRNVEALCKAASAETDPALYVARNQAFHLSLYQPAARPRLLEMIGMLHVRGERYLRLKLGLPSYKGESDREHAALLKAVRLGDVAAAQSLLTKHLLDTGELLHRFLCQDAEAVESARTPPGNSRMKRQHATFGS